MKNISNILIMVLTIIILIPLSGCVFVLKSCKVENYEVSTTKDYGNFVYCDVTGSGSRRLKTNGTAEHVAILEIQGCEKEKDIVVIPETVEGKPVILVGMQEVWGCSFTNWYIEGKYTKLYLPKGLKKVNDLKYQKIDYFYVGDPGEVDFELASGVYVSEEVFTKYTTGKYVDKEGNNLYPMQLKLANVRYLIEGQTYWIDNYTSEEGTLIAEPPTPTKEGYVFDGWYQEDNFLKWDFSKDKHFYTKDMDVMRFYGKWVKE